MIVIIDVTLRHEFHGSCANLQRNGEPSHPDVNGALDAIKPPNAQGKARKLPTRVQLAQFLLPSAVKTTSGRIGGDFPVCFTYSLIVKQRTTSHACAQATAMRIDIALHKRPRKKQTRHVPNPQYLHIPPHTHLHY